MPTEREPLAFTAARSMRTAWLAFFVALPALAATNRALAQGAAPQAVRGVVQDSSGIGVPNVEVVLPALALSVRTDSAGRWRFPAVPPGRHELIARRLGLLSRRGTLEIIAGDTSRIVITVSSTVQTLARVIVSARRNALPGTFARQEARLGQVFFAEDIEAKKMFFMDIHEMIRDMPRIGQAMRRVRVGCVDGGSPFFVNGRRLPRTGLLRMYVTPYEVEAFEVVRGRGAYADEQRRLPGAENRAERVLDPDIALCSGVVLIWTKSYVARKNAASPASAPKP